MKILCKNYKTLWLVLKITLSQAREQIRRVNRYWVEQFLIKELKPGQYVVLDNASFHKSKKIKELIESVDCKVIFLPPYSPDLNPIEKFWANMKRWIKGNINRFNKLFDTLVEFFNTQIST